MERGRGGRMGGVGWGGGEMKWRAGGHAVVKK